MAQRREWPIDFDEYLRGPYSALYMDYVDSTSPYWWAESNFMWFRLMSTSRTTSTHCSLIRKVGVWSKS